MKYTIYLFIIFFFCACAKEDDLSNDIDFSNVYAISDDANDPVQHERYLIFKDFDVSVYFNDTINQVYVRDDIYGNPVYRYELIDVAWTFFNDANQSISGTLNYEYVEGQERQLKNLEVIRTFLEKTSAALRPSLILAVEAAQIENGDMVQDLTYRTNFRCMLWTNLASKDDVSLEKEILEIQKNSISKKIENFTTQINKFGEVSNPTDYGRTYLFNNFPGSDKYGFMAMNNWWAYPQTLWGVNEPRDYQEWLAAKENPRYDETYGIESTKAYCAVVGPYGFVRGSKNVRNNAPADVSEDLGWYLDLMLMYTPEEFEYYWGSYPLVMEKYQILYDVIVNELGVEL